MSFDLVEIFVLLAAVVGSASLAGLGAWFWGRVKRLEEAGGVADYGGIGQQLEALEDELRASRVRTERLAERMDFLERLLEARRSDPDDPEVQIPAAGEEETDR